MFREKESVYGIDEMKKTSQCIQTCHSVKNNAALAPILNDVSQYEWGSGNTIPSIGVNDVPTSVSLFLFFVALFGEDCQMRYFCSRKKARGERRHPFKYRKLTCFLQLTLILEHPS